jgi:hypothetical protein
MTTDREGFGAVAYLCGGAGLCAVILAVILAASQTGCVTTERLAGFVRPEPTAVSTAAPASTATQEQAVVVGPAVDIPPAPDASTGIVATAGDPEPVPEPEPAPAGDSPAKITVPPRPSSWMEFSGHQTNILTVATPPAISERVYLAAWLYPREWRSFGGREQHGLGVIQKGVIGHQSDYALSLQRDGWLIYSSTKGGFGICRPVVPLGTWTHVACLVDERAGAVSFWVNGVLQDSVTGFAGYPWRDNPDRWIQPSEAPLYIGGLDQHGPDGKMWPYNNDNFIGRIGAVEIRGGP